MENPPNAECIGADLIIITYISYALVILVFFSEE